MRRVVVTGLGAVTSLAAGVEASWSRLLAGRSGTRGFQTMWAWRHLTRSWSQGSGGTAELI
jgi:3-oxoacyl-(acyl-carrier-protein) synthase